MRTALRSQVWVLILMQDFLDRSRGGAQSSGREEVLLRLLQKKRGNFLDSGFRWLSNLGGDSRCILSTVVPSL